jgi:hypothetical protein
MGKGKYLITRVKYWDNTNQETVSIKVNYRTDDVEEYKVKFKKKMKPIQVGFINLVYREVGLRRGGRHCDIEPQIVYDYHCLNPDVSLRDLAVKFGVSHSTISNYISEGFKLNMAKR